MSDNMALVHALAAITMAAVSSGIVATIASKIKTFVSRRPQDVIVKLETGETIKLELDRHLSEEKARELVMQAVTSAQGGDNKAINRAIAASKTASKEARAAAS